MGPVHRKKEEKINKTFFKKVSNLIFIQQINNKILTLFPGGPEGPDSPVGPGEP